MSNNDQVIYDLIDSGFQNANDSFEKQNKTFSDYQKKYDVNYKKLEKLISSSMLNFSNLHHRDLEDFEKHILDNTKSNQVLSKSDYDKYFDNLNQNINNQFSLFEGFFMGVVIMYIFFSRLFKNV